MKIHSGRKSKWGLLIPVVVILAIFAIVYYFTASPNMEEKQQEIFDEKFQGLSPAITRCENAVAKEKEACNEKAAECVKRSVQDPTVKCSQGGQQCIKAIQNTGNECAEVFIERQRILNTIELG